jgi:hypothetical protein
MNLVEPIFEVGCGRNGALVSLLREVELEKYGIDRLITQETHLRKVNRLRFDFRECF